MDIKNWEHQCSEINSVPGEYEAVYREKAKLLSSKKLFAGHFLKTALIMPISKKSTFEPDGLANNHLISNTPFKALMLEHAVLIWLNISA